MNTFQLKPFVLGTRPSIEFTADEVAGLKEAKRRVSEFLAIEDLFGIVLDNYEEFERELLSATLNYAMFNDAEPWTPSVDTIRLIARRLANLLTTTHAYCDQLPHSVSSVYGGGSEQHGSVKRLFRREHSGILGYRVCTELRKYAQHRGSPVHGIRRHGRWVTRPDGRRVRLYAVVPEVNIRKLREDPKVKPAVLTELDVDGNVSLAGDRMKDLRPFVRDYISALGRVHTEVRSMLAADADQADATLAAAVTRYEALEDANGSLGLAVVELNERGLIEDRLPVFIGTGVIQRRKLLEARHHRPQHFGDQVITNELELT